MSLLDALSNEGRVAAVDSRDRLSVVDLADFSSKTIEGVARKPKLISFRDGELLISSDQGVLQFIAASTGQHLWETNLYSPVTALLFEDHRLLVGCEDGSLYVLHRETGVVLARKQLATRIVSIHSNGDRGLHVGLRNGTVHSINLPKQLR